MKKIILIVFLALFLISFVNAEQQSLGTFKKDSCVNLIQTCSNCSFINITSVVYPNSTNAITNKLMTKSNSLYNYSFCLTNVSGTYIVNGLGNPDGINTVFAYDFEINPIGIPATEVRATAMNRAVYILFIIAIVLFIAFLYTQNVPFKYSALILSFTFLVAGINLIFVTLTNEVVDPTVIELFDFITAASFYFYWLAGGMLIIIWILTFFNTMNESFAHQRYDKFGGNMTNGKNF